MGVKGLWRLLLPIGRRISIETLEGKILAVDASIWMTQFLKAMRDPESGAVRPAAHIIGFFRRLCKLRFHGIRPVFVFDGATPDIKRRELQQRRRRRDHFVAQHGAEAVQRLAKRLLVEQLKKSKLAKTRVDAQKNVTIQLAGGGAVAGANSLQQQEETGGDGAFVEGFFLPSSSNDKKKNQEKNEKKEVSSATEIINVDDDNDNSQFEIRNGEMIITSSSGTSKPGNTAAVATTAGVDDVNDWDKPINVDDDDDDDDDNDDKEEEKESDQEEVVEYDDVLWTSRSRKSRKRNKRKRSSDDIFDIDHVVSLNPVDRKEAIEMAQKEQRMRSRKEFLPVAANAQEYSQVQLRNFLRSSKLNKDIVKMAKKAVHKDSKVNGEVTAADRTRRVIFEKENNKDKKKKSRLLLSDDDDDGSSDDYSGDEDEDEDSDSGGEGFLKTTERPTSARRKMAKQGQQQYHQDGQETKEPQASSKPRHKLRRVGASFDRSDSGDDASDDGGVFFKEDATCTTSSNPAARKRRVIDGDDDNSDASEVGGGGFLPNSGGANPNHDSNDGGFIRSNDAERVGPLEGHHRPCDRARKVHFSDSEDSADEIGGFTAKAAKKLKHPKTVKKQTLYTRASNPFRSIGDDDDNDDGDDISLDGGGFLLGKPVSNNTAQLKTTGLEDEVIVFDEDEPFIGDAAKAQELQDLMLAKALQEEEDAQLAASMEETGITAADSSEDEAFQVAATRRQHNCGFKQPESQENERDMKTSAGDMTSERVQISGSQEMKSPPSIMQTGEDESEDDDVDWEDCDEPVNDGKLSHLDGSKLKSPAESTIMGAGPEKAMDGGAIEGTNELEHTSTVAESEATKRSIKTAPFIARSPNTDTFSSIHQEPITAPTSSDSHSDDDVDWEDADKVAASSIEVRKDQRTAPIDENSMEEKALPHSSDPENSVEETPSDSSAVDFGAHEDNPNVYEIDDFGVGTREDETAAALEQAEETAANLTNWAGRAMRRAIAEHLSQDRGGAKQQSRRPSQQDKEARDVEVITISDDAEQSGARGISDAVTRASAVNHGFIVNQDHDEDAADLLQGYENELSEAARNNVERETDTVTDEMKEEIMQLLQLFGVPYVQAPAEAEAQCVALEKLGLVNGVVTEDSDVFVFGGKTVYKNIFDDQKYVEVYLADDAEREMGLGTNEFVALAMLLGGDYSEGVKGVGIVNGMEVVSSFDVSTDLKGGLEKFRTWLNGFEPIVEAKARKDTGSGEITKEQAFHIKHRSARNRWNAPENFPSGGVISAYVNPVVDKSTTKFSFGVPDMENIARFCNRHAGWVAEDTRRLLKPVIERVEDTSRQTRIDSFMRYEDGIKFASVRSKRLRDVLGIAQKEGTGNKRSKSAKKRRKESSGKKGRDTDTETANDHNSNGGTVDAGRTIDLTSSVDFAADADEPFVRGQDGVSFARNLNEAVAPGQRAINNESLVSVLADDAFASGSTQPREVNQAGATKSKTKTKSLTAYLGAVKAPEENIAKKPYSEEYRAKLNKAAIPTNVAPPAYSRKSELAASLREKSNKIDPTFTAPREKDD